MIDFRLYRVAWIPALLAFVVMMFSLEGVPEPPDPQIAPAAFDSERARQNVREILALGDDRSPGSDADAGTAALVQERFDEIAAGTTSLQTFEADVDGEKRELRNVAITLAGESDEVILVTAGRDSAEGPGAASSASATAALLELAETLGGTEHAKTFVLVSTDASTDGAEGIRQFLDGFDEPGRIAAALSLHQPGAAEPVDPFVLRHSTDDRSTSMQLVRIAEETLSEQSGREPEGRGVFAELARLALPMAAGEQSVLIAEEVDAVGISSAGEKPLDPAEDDEEHFSAGTLEEFGAATLGVILVLDPLVQPLQHGPDTYVEFSESLVPGWAIAVFTLALLLPAVVAAVDGVARAARRRAGEIRALVWAFALALPLAALVLVIVLLGAAGIVPSPSYPFDPGHFSLGFSEALLLVLLAAATAAGYLLGGLLHPPRRPWREALAPALGSAAGAGALAVWLLNPFLALLLVPLAHAWLLAGRRPGSSRLLPLLVGLVCLLLPLLALRSSAGAVGAGPWDVILTVANGHLPAATLVAATPLMGTLVGMFVLAWHAPEARTNDRAGIGVRPQARWVPDSGSPASVSIDPSSPEADESPEPEANHPKRDNDSEPET